MPPKVPRITKIKFYLQLTIRALQREGVGDTRLEQILNEDTNNKIFLENVKDYISGTAENRYMLFIRFYDKNSEGVEYKPVKYFNKFEKEYLDYVKYTKIVWDILCKIDNDKICKDVLPLIMGYF